MGGPSGSVLSVLPPLSSLVLAPRPTTSCQVGPPPTRGPSPPAAAAQRASSPGRRRPSAEPWGPPGGVDGRRVRRLSGPRAEGEGVGAAASGSPRGARTSCRPRLYGPRLRATSSSGSYAGSGPPSSFYRSKCSNGSTRATAAGSEASTCFAGSRRSGARWTSTRGRRGFHSGVHPPAPATPRAAGAGSALRVRSGGSPQRRRTAGLDPADSLQRTPRSRSRDRTPLPGPGTAGSAGLGEDQVPTHSRLMLNKVPVRQGVGRAGRSRKTKTRKRERRKEGSGHVRPNQT